MNALVRVKPCADKTMKVMEAILEKVALCVERGKADSNSPYPTDMKGQQGAAELTQKALEIGIPPNDILSKGLIVGMHKIGEKFSEGKAFIPDLLIAAKAMNTAMEHLKPFFESGEAQHKGKFIIGTVAGDLHDIGKNIVRIVMEGNGWEVIDLGTNVSTEKFNNAVEQHHGCVVGLSCLLTTTMINMEKTVKKIKLTHPKVLVIVGGAPITEEFSKKIQADAYFPDPHSLVDYLDQIGQTVY